MEQQSMAQSEPNSTPTVKPGSYSPVNVTVNDSWGAVMLGILSVANENSRYPANKMV